MHPWNRWADTLYHFCVRSPGAEKQKSCQWRYVSSRPLALMFSIQLWIFLVVIFLWGFRKIVFCQISFQVSVLKDKLTWLRGLKTWFFKTWISIIFDWQSLKWKQYTSERLFCISQKVNFGCFILNMMNLLKTDS